MIGPLLSFLQDTSENNEVCGERTGGNSISCDRPDGYEQPFHSIDVNYSFYPSDSWTVKLKVQNILDETVEIRRAGIVTFSDAPGMAVSLKVKYDF
jgi:hypothetical protein